MMFRVLKHRRYIELVLELAQHFHRKGDLGFRFHTHRWKETKVRVVVSAKEIKRMKQQ